VLAAVGVKEKWLTSKEQEAAIRGVIRQIVYKADTQRSKSNSSPALQSGESDSSKRFG